jgi:glucokinase
MTAASNLILAADVGGTKTNIALFDRSAPALSQGVVFRASLPSAAYAGLGDLVADFLQRAHDVAPDRPRAACFGIPGPIADQACETSNLPWRVRAADLRQRFEIPRVCLLNDLEATAHAVSALEEAELTRLSPASHAEPDRPRAVVAAGTGLGMAIIVPDGGGFRPCASEGGHVEFAPQNELEIDLLRFLQRDHAHVSVERVVSGPGLARLYDFFSERGAHPKNQRIGELMRQNPVEAPAAIATAALAHECAVSSAALDLFVRLYGAVAGNLALTACATGGLYLAGGIAPKILPKLQQGGFMQGFLDKGRLQSLVERVPVYVVLNEQAPLLGAAHYGSRALS